MAKVNAIAAFVVAAVASIQTPVRAAGDTLTVVFVIDLWDEANATAFAGVADCVAYSKTDAETPINDTLKPGDADVLKLYQRTVVNRLPIDRDKVRCRSGNTATLPPSDARLKPTVVVSLRRGWVYSVKNEAVELTTRPIASTLAASSSEKIRAEFLADIITTGRFTSPIVPCASGICRDYHRLWALLDNERNSAFARLSYVGRFHPSPFTGLASDNDALAALVDAATAVNHRSSLTVQGGACGGNTASLLYDEISLPHWLLECDSQRVAFTGNQRLVYWPLPTQCQKHVSYSFTVTSTDNAQLSPELLLVAHDGDVRRSFASNSPCQQKDDATLSVSEEVALSTSGVQIATLQGFGKTPLGVSKQDLDALYKLVEVREYSTKKQSGKAAAADVLRITRSIRSPFGYQAALAWSPTGNESFSCSASGSLRFDCSPNPGASFLSTGVAGDGWTAFVPFQLK